MELAHELGLDRDRDVPVEAVSTPAQAAPHIPNVDVSKAKEEILEVVRRFLESSGLIASIATTYGRTPDEASDTKMTFHSIEQFLHSVQAISERYGFNETGRSPQKRKFANLDSSNLEYGDSKHVKIDPELVQTCVNKSEINHRIESFIQSKRTEIDNSNRNEFVKPRGGDSGIFFSLKKPLCLETTAELYQNAFLNTESTCARTDAADLNRTIQMKLDVVHNESGPLERSTHRTSSAPATSKNADSSTVPAGVEERLRNVQRHLNVELISPVPLDVYSRLQALENKIMQMEADFPAWAAFHLNQPKREHQENPVLREPPPVTIVSKTPTGILSAAVVPAVPVHPQRGRATPKPSTNSVSSSNNIRVQEGSLSAGNGGKDGDVKVLRAAESDAESIERRIQALKESLRSKAAHS
ncbi:hypothetical protein HK104_001526 [Borealophlyctis nickersoniae]|nr:hypothetical protein HK104_001526 [Borealophlyctis nickersoniae]